MNKRGPMTITDNALKAAIESIAGAITPNNIAYEKSVGDLTGWCSRLRERLCDLADALSVTQPIKAGVKALEWYQELDHIAVAISPVGVWRIWNNLTLETPAPSTTKRYSTVEDAKAAAQADYETRIISALQATPTSGEQAVGWVTEATGLEVATIQHDAYSILELSKPMAGDCAFVLTVHSSTEETSRWDDLSIGLTAREAGDLASYLRPTPPSPLPDRGDGMREAALKEALKRIEDTANGRDTLDGFPRSKDERQRRLAEIYEIAASVRVALKSTPPQPVAGEPGMEAPGHSPQIKQSLETAIESIQARPPELRGGGKDEAQTETVKP